MNTVIGVQPVAGSTVRMFLLDDATPVLVLDVEGATLSLRAPAGSAGGQVLAGFCIQLAHAAQRVAAFVATGVAQGEPDAEREA